MSYSLAEADWSAFQGHLESRGFSYTTESLAVLDELEEVVDIEQYAQVAEAPLSSLRAALSPDLQRDLGLFEPEIRQALEEEVVLRFHLAAGMVERSLTEDPTVLRAQAVFGEEMASILGEGAMAPGASDPQRR